MGKHGRKLTAAFVRSVREPGLYWDEHGLVLRVKPSGYKQWIQRLFIHGKRRELGLGPFRLVTLAEARDAAVANRKVARAGGDPRTKRHSSVPTFEQAAAKVFAMHRANWTERHAGQWMATLRTYAYPGIGGKRVDRIRSADVMGVLMPIWNDKYQTAKRVRQRISTVMRWAIAQGYRVDNPAGDAIGAALPKPPRIQKHYKALPYDQVAGALATVRRSEARLSVKLGIEFLVLTAGRSGEVRGARWEEIDTRGGVWTIPAERMKSRREHRVPLSGRAVEVLAEAKAHARRSECVFPSARGLALTSMDFSGLLKTLGIGAVPHGFRSSFRDWAAERTDAPHAVMEAALAHAVRDKAEAAYARSDLFERRRVLMEQWAEYLVNGTQGR
ncbi:MAG: tyrosine-type recombinase/integrase [Gemmatimonadetes bacterium]|nr:tyrosine-type recombinase/integrase [Gemmatimonadota bacterium]MYG23601.1 tyrosine-type recombinase/integrase [Gemmatimonadota bacterium]MYJ39258.1 tyrosine-type recombinase/integrase [Gemmatimonadota bacterium]